jgi:hypothetical protein
MERTQVPVRPLALLPPGTVVGSWRVVAWASRGVNGAVYKAVRVGQEYAPPVALKLALMPADPRFAREVVLLSRTRHPSIPRMVDSGQWQHPSGSTHPYIAMEWVDGVPLYDWALQHVPSPPQVLRLLAQLAGALQELHAQGGVHRDIKGGNILVRSSDGRAVLTDFGSGFYDGASSLTPPASHPGTPAYRSPEAALLELRSPGDCSARHTAGPAEDLYSLGVTACRLLTGEYPRPNELFQDAHGTLHVASVSLPPALLQVEPKLRAIILRLLSVRPEERGTAAQLAETLEQSTSRHRRGSAERVSSPGSTWPWWPSLATAAAGVALAAWVWWLVPDGPVEKPSVVHREAGSADQQDGGTAGLGEVAPAAAMEDSPPLFLQEHLAEEPLPEPEEEQTRPDAKGRCPHKGQVVLNGGCWAPLRITSEECEAASGQMFKDRCYVPVFAHGRRHPRTSHRAHRP